jgi:hypothetical protein
MQPQILSHDQRVSGMPFTHPAYIEIERRQLQYMLMRLHWIMDTFFWRKSQTNYAPIERNLVEADGRNHRILVIRPHLLAQSTGLCVVGFFGQRMMDGDMDEADRRDGMLNSEMNAHEGLLSYSSLELTNGDYGNCVVFTDEAAKNKWGFSPTHKEIVEDLSPSYYESVRLYNGTLPKTIMDEHLLQLNLVKYLCYQQNPPWLAIRPLQSQPVSA